MVIVGVVNELPVPIAVPPVADEYQFKAPELAVAPNTKVPASHLDAGEVELIVGEVFTVAKTAVLVELQPLAVA